MHTNHTHTKFKKKQNSEKNTQTNKQKQMEIATYHNSKDKELKHNPKAEYLFAPVQGPLPEGVKDSERHVAFQQPQTTLTGHVELHNMDDYTFDEQYHTYQNFGYALDPSRGNCFYFCFDLVFSFSPKNRN